MKELGVSTNENYKLTCMLDHSAMVRLKSTTIGKSVAHLTLLTSHRFKMLIEHAPTHVEHEYV